MARWGPEGVAALDSPLPNEADEKRGGDPDSPSKALHAARMDAGSPVTRLDCLRWDPRAWLALQGMDASVARSGGAFGRP